MESTGNDAAGRLQKLEIAVAVSLAIQELDRLKALECLPTPETLYAHLRARESDINLLVGVAGAYLNPQGGR